MKKILLLILFAFSFASAQNITWTDVTSSYSPIPGVKVFKGTRSSLTAYYFDVDMTNPKVAIRPYITNSLATEPELLKRFGAYAAVNGGYFGGTSAYSAVVYPFEVKAQNIAALTRNSQTYPVMRSFFGIKKDGSMSIDWIYHFGGATSDIYKFSAPLPYTLNDPAPKAAPQKSDGTQYEDLLTGIGGGPRLVKNGQEHVTYNEEILWGSGVYMDDYRTRTAIGYRADKHVIILCADNLQLQELPSIFISLGCTEAMNLDGGGSTEMSIGSQDLITSSRALPVILAIVNPDSLKLPKTPVFEKIIDTGDKEASVTGSWFTSANAGYYGTTQSMLTGIGNGNSCVSFKPELKVSAEYELYAWWVSSSNRTKDTPFIISHKDGIDTVRIDQTVNGSMWSLIGKYTFSADTTDKITISNAAKSGSYVVADAIRLVSYDAATSSVEESRNNPVVSQYRLNQNYPNPFNPVTRISYYMPKEGHVSLRVFDVLGNEVARLVDEVESAGSHQAEFSAQNLSSGIYFYTLNSGSFIETKKLMVLK
ncbi:MAG: T9SS type A sorting domain-containing protein [Ignavibacteria bacterium]|jgi:exopolysaccharide biosynthesis protein|nr:T9SS type A sorting domain-containing protein [Ignavibacteria bacterium]MCU7501668.1 T9SS type A sorting domain-containing protein [Ignavibacteria bacterium]MCU7517743.1 T9SS type A sorting domain-containing protein [Ignavibacteria bacterium]